MQVRIVGAGEAFDSGVGNNSFLLDVPRGPRVLIDCGYQIPERLWAPGLHRDVDAVYLTHTHADHAFGMVPLLTRFWEERRRRPLTIIGHRGVKSFVTKALDLGFPGIASRFAYPIEFITVRPGRALEWRDLTLHTARSRHGVMNLSVRFTWRDRRCAFSGDGAITEDTAALYAGVDTLFHELFATRRDVPGHTNLTQLRRLVDAIRPPRVVVSHHGRRYKAGVRRAVAKLGPCPTEWVSGEPGQTFAI